VPVAAATTRDPALPARVALTVVLLLLLWPALELTEFDPRKLFEPSSLQVMGRFLGTFFPLALGGDFLGLALRSTLETLALATAGMASEPSRMSSVSRFGEATDPESRWSRPMTTGAASSPSRTIRLNARPRRWRSW
jgi:hypothetical protein